jgi:hypothetical protein
MSVHFHVGQRVACIIDRSEWWPSAIASLCPCLPNKGSVYIVSRSSVGRSSLGLVRTYLHLEEAPGWRFEASSFRPLVEKKTSTSIEVLKKLLAPSPRKLEEVS